MFPLSLSITHYLPSLSLLIISSPTLSHFAFFPQNYSPSHLRFKQILLHHLLFFFFFFLSSSSPRNGNTSRRRGFNPTPEGLQEILKCLEGTISFFFFCDSFNQSLNHYLALSIVSDLSIIFLVIQSTYFLTPSTELVSYSLIH